ncbi:hypothetical protein, conserved [Trypanosoma brucei gambiense DAL972]|uniref:RING-type E3 ubiquitin transferase n=2 Tax=Trypanosoma brucei TaxID=5691 RepID=D0A2D8_TRYB9|nr:hypothetical protein, conserved [Trypanosoma brucei gambiense DAL972]RHW69243.1 putative zinc finger protein [Trypanosoma brucei equiperdum]CBH15432.1 hypothetical protein, conserved [Trypanosoma brucei gambiense DAL972]|eukprot:XP_011777696.1 hypothetical protein, conserved [Trypanosoma brucei gambiense DAL972]
MSFFRGLNFSNMDDGVDWENAVPPHITAQRNIERAALRNAAPRRAMLMDWPLPEDMGAPTVAERRLVQSTASPGSGAPDVRRATRVPELREVRQGSERRSLNRSHPNSHHTQLRPQTSQQLVRADGNIFSALSGIANEMLQAQLSMVSAFNDFFSEGRSDAMNAMGGTASAGVLHGNEVTSVTQQRSVQRGSNSGVQVRRVMVAAQSVNGQRPQVAVQVDEWSGPPATRTRNNNRSGSDFDIITGVPRRILYISSSDEGTGRGDPRGGNGNGSRGAGGGWEIDDFSYENLLRLDDNAEKTGLPEAQLRGLKRTTYNAAKRSGATRRGNANPDNAEKCPVCLEQLVDGAEVHEIACGHVSHHSCIIPWLRRSNCCPTCRYEIPRLKKR